MPAPETPYYDILILGAGFSGILALYEARKRGLKAHIFESQNDLGGTWKANNYPGARVDSEAPVYELIIPEVYDTWNWAERFPDWRELRKYFDHVENVLHIKKDTTFNCFIDDASFDSKSGLWTIRNKDGSVSAKGKFFFPLIGFASRKYTPNFPGFENFKGQVFHSVNWPEPVDLDYSELKNKKIGIIGTGSTGVQIIQESGPRCKELTVFQRTPNLSLPMHQKKFPIIDKSKYFDALSKRFNNPGGFLDPACKIKTFDQTAEEREKFWDSLFDYGAFLFLTGNYADLLFDEKANREAYNYWRKSVHKRINDPIVAEKLAPKTPPHPFGAKRLSLEQNYYEQFNRPNVHLVDVNENPIKEFYENGIITADNRRHELDLLILATGFDSNTGSWKNFNVWNKNHFKTIGEEWDGEDGCSTYLGLSVAGYPNMFFTYGPQAPTAFSNGPSCISLQMEYIFRIIDKMNAENIKFCEPSEEGQKAFRKKVDDFAATTLYPKAKSWYMGANIPGKKIQMLNYSEGVPGYHKLLQSNTKKDFEGFEFWRE